MAVQKNSNKKSSKQQEPEKKEFFNFGAGWIYEDSGTVNCTVDWKQNQKKNKGQGFKMFLVPVDDTGEPDFDEAIETKYFRFRPVEKDNKAPENAPDYSLYTWKQ